MFFFSSLCAAFVLLLFALKGSGEGRHAARFPPFLQFLCIIYRGDVTFFQVVDNWVFSNIQVIILIIIIIIIFIQIHQPTSSLKTQLTTLSILKVNRNWVRELMVGAETLLNRLNGCAKLTFVCTGSI